MLMARSSGDVDRLQERIPIGLDRDALGLLIYTRPMGKAGLTLQ
jgi:hypothetical protein